MVPLLLKLEDIPNLNPPTPLMIFNFGYKAQIEVTLNRFEWFKSFQTIKVWIQRTLFDDDVVEYNTESNCNMFWILYILMGIFGSALDQIEEFSKEIKP